MADVQILAAAAASAPEHYEVPNTQEIIPKAVAASFDGTGASGSFVALCEIVSDAGIVVAQGKSDTIAAGGSAYVSWFPGGGLGSGAAFTPDVAVYASLGAPSIPSDTSLHACAMTLQGTSNSAVFGQGTGSLGVTGPQINAEGLYWISYGTTFSTTTLDLPSDNAQFGWSPTIPTYEGITNRFASFNFAAGEPGYFAEPGGTGLFSVGSSGDFAIGSVFNARLQQNSGGAITPSVPELVIVRVNPTADGSL